MLPVLTAVALAFSSPLTATRSAVAAVAQRSALMMVDAEATRDAGPSVEIVAAVTDWQAPALSKVTSTLDLRTMDYPADIGFDAFTIGGSTGKVESFEGPGAPNVAWCSGLQMSGNVAKGSVTAFCGPLTDVPHLIAVRLPSLAAAESCHRRPP